jgi:prevent-host-death family protein
MKNLISVSDVSKNTSATIAKAAAGETQIILNHNKPIAAIVDIKLLEEIEEYLFEQHLLEVVRSRVLDADGNEKPLEELLEGSIELNEFLTSRDIKIEDV